MAIYHLTTKSFSRGKGQSAKAKHDYVTREGRFANDADEVMYKESGNMPSWAENDSQAFWKAADRNERVNGRLGREIEFALPRELPLERQIELARAFVQDVTQGQHPYTLAVHEGKGENPHVHLIFSERTNDGIERPQEQFFRVPKRDAPELGGARKNREFISKTWLLQTREKWAGMANDHLEQSGFESRIDHRSLADQHVVRTPGRHVGPTANAQEKENAPLNISEAGVLKTVRALWPHLDNDERENVVRLLAGGFGRDEVGERVTVEAGNAPKKTRSEAVRWVAELAGNNNYSHVVVEAYNRLDNPQDQHIQGMPTLRRELPELLAKYGVTAEDIESERGRRPGRHVGAAVYAMERKGQRTDRGSDLIRLVDSEQALWRELGEVGAELSAAVGQALGPDRQRPRGLER